MLRIACAVFVLAILACDSGDSTPDPDAAVQCSADWCITVDGDKDPVCCFDKDAGSQNP